MYLILFNNSNQATCIVPCGNITKDDSYLFDKLPDFTPQEGYANSLQLNGDSLEWHFTKLPESTITISPCLGFNFIISSDKLFSFYCLDQLGAY